MFGLNFLKKLFTSLTEKTKPVVVMTNFGIFIRSALDNFVIIDKCTELLQSIQSHTKILHASRDEVHNGLKVLLNSDSGIPELLKKKFLSGSDDSSTIHSLTTALIVHQAFPTNEEEFKESIRNQIGNLVPAQVLDITKVPLSSKYPEIGTGKWIIVLDIPEVDELEEFKTMGLPENMVLKFPTNYDCLKVEFHCRLCKKDGHIQHRCLNSDASYSSLAIHSSLGEARSNENSRPMQPVGLYPKEKTTHLPGTSNSSSTYQSEQKNLIQKTKVASPPRPPANTGPSGFRIRDSAEERPKPVNNPTVSPRDIENFIREIGQEEVRRSLGEHHDIKQEINEPITSSMARPIFESFRNCFRSRDTNETISGETSSNRASSTTTEKDSLEIIFESDAIRRSEHIQSPPENSPVVTTTNQQPVAPKRELPSTDDDEDSNPTPPKRQKKTLRMLPVVIPDGIREIISGMPDGVLDVRQLEAFFNHVKKKSRPSDFAEMYTRDVEGLHAQMVAISRRYYNSPKVGSNADVQFMKMMGNVLKRFYNVPAQRRGARQ